jgi:hypothetical protein
MNEVLLVIPYFLYLGLINVAVFYTIKENL